VQTSREGLDARYRHGSTRSILSRPRRAWDALDANQRLAGLAAVALLLTLFLPWYSQTDTVVVGSGAKSALSSAHTTLSGFQAFSFVEAALLLVSASVLAMLYARAEGQPFRLPGGDGLIIMIAGGWTALLVFYRMLDTPSLHGTHRIMASVGVEWGIFLALICALAMAVAGSRMRARREPAPPLLRPRGSSSEESEGTSEPLLARGRPRYPPAPAAPRTPPLRSARTASVPAPRYPDRGV
jgi:hypothetical protein